MAWNNSDELVVAGAGQVYIAASGTTLPADYNAATSLSPSTWTGLGYHTEDGVSFSATPEIVENRAWQARQAIRRERTSQDLQFTFSLLQWNEATVVLAFGGGSITTVTGGYKYEFPDADSAALAEYAVVVECIDGSEKHYFAFSRVNVTETVESQFTAQNPAVLPITLKVLPPASGGSPGRYLTNSTAFVTGS